MLLKLLKLCCWAVDCSKLLCALESSSFVEAVESAVGAVESVVKAVDCCGLFCVLETEASFVEAVESLLLKLLSLLLKLIVILCSREL